MVRRMVEGPESRVRIRSIHPDALKSKKLRSASAEAERCYWRLQVVCDDEGRCEDDPDVLADQLFLGWRCIEPEDVDGWLWELHSLELIVRYTVNGDDLIQVGQWPKYQHPQHPKKSALSPFLPSTERSHEDSPDHGEDNDLSGVEKPSARPFMNGYEPSPVEKQQRSDAAADPRGTFLSGTGWVGPANSLRSVGA